jgi:hypothetical protein
LLAVSDKQISWGAVLLREETIEALPTEERRVLGWSAACSYVCNIQCCPLVEENNRTKMARHCYIFYIQCHDYGDPKSNDLHHLDKLTHTDKEDRLKFQIISKN